MADEQKLKSPRELTKRPPSRAPQGPKHERLGGHGIRTTAETQDELNQEAFDEAQAEDYSRVEKRTTGAGPNPYKLEQTLLMKGDKRVKDLQKERDKNELDNSLLMDHALAAHAEAAGESDAADAEVAIPGETITDSGQKIVLKPERVAADERAVLERKDITHAAAIDEHDPEALQFDYRVPVAHAEAVAVSEDPLRADANPGAGAPDPHKRYEEEGS
jgi:hypothetical protein